MSAVIREGKRKRFCHGHFVAKAPTKRVVMNGEFIEKIVVLWSEKIIMVCKKFLERKNNHGV